MIILDLSPFPKILKPGGHYLLVLLIIDFFCNDKDPDTVNRYIATVTYGPTYYRNLTTAPTKAFIASRLAKIRSRNQTRRSKDKANNLTEYRQMLHTTFEKKQYGRIIKLLTGDFSPQLDPHDLPRPNGEHLTDPSNVYKQHPRNSSDTTAAPPTNMDRCTMNTRTGPQQLNPEPCSVRTLRT